MQSDLFTKSGTLRKNKPGAGRPRQMPAEWTKIDRSRFKRFGVTPTDVRDMLERQGGCAVCRTPEPRGKNGWHVDHDHETGRVRGVLCITCNIAIGMLHDDLARARQAVAYLERSSLF